MDETNYRNGSQENAPVPKREHLYFGRTYLLKELISWIHIYICISCIRASRYSIDHGIKLALVAMHERNHRYGRQSREDEKNDRCADMPLLACKKNPMKQCQD
ncbi:hypothetical protein KIN20_020400 [Parelaphostrongylus tenuis]|uniref:Uncharacterized protein n=1 Tax=Parelaphostrongylus tenuis TaxID=148309 RepID=A0AAD5MSU0_PARTN|nr:hypothetical protein KIN20_020400 [Parelaphostrongylus tenuis]